MPKKKGDDLDSTDVAMLVKALQGKFGEAGVMLGEDMPVPDYISTGLPDLDMLLGGGLQKGRMYEIFGEEDAGKSTLAMHIAMHVSQAVWFNADKSFSAQRYTELGGDMGKLIIVNENILSHVGEMLYRFAAAGVPLCIVDMLAALVPDKVDEGGVGAMGDKSAVAPLAAFFAEKLSLILNVAWQTGTVILFLNRVSQLINVRNPYAYPYTTVGGHQKNALAAARIAVGKGMKIEANIDGKPIKLGHTLAFSTFASSVSAPGQRGEAPLFYRFGLVLPEQLVEAKKQAVLAYKEAKLLEAPAESGSEENAGE